MQRIGEQKPTLENLLSIYRSTEPNSDLTMQIASLYELFADVKMETTDVQVIDDPENNSSVIQSNSSINMTQEKFDVIAEKIKEIRTSIIQ
jgi:hypothetical protein